MMILQNLQDEDVEWRAHWIVPDEILYRCRDFDWVPLLRIWRAIGYAPLLFIPTTQELVHCEFVYNEDNYKKKVREISNTWNQTRRIKRFVANSMTTPEYDQWWGHKINDNIPTLDQENTRSIKEHLQVISSELDIIKQDFEKKSLELGKRIEQLEDEKMQLGLDVDVQKLEAEKLRKGMNKVEKDLDSFKTDYKKLRRSMRTAGLGKTSEKWRQEIKEEKNRTDQWENECQDAQVRGNTLERDLSECQNKKIRLKARVTELEKSFHQCCNRNSTIQLKASIKKIEELKWKIEELEITLQNCELRVELFEASNE
ncbi:coiled-coil domain-containing protein 102A-like protein [Gossypium australe]|uniref:Coiled-coil domain-containing protein 102A-like protein n=1 Tax=Gossypium australe TaxID=47621 RepID=A0A5B6W4D1_9ROSI|nr:coiled-coil domain-containing protein 102A-like protein [Gossypium australe]